MKNLVAAGKTTALDLFTEPFLSDGLTGSYDIEVTPVKHTDKIVQFTEPGHPDHFIDMSQVYLSIECVIMKKGQSEPIDPDTRMRTKQILLDALFSHSILSLNRTEIGDTSENFAVQNALLYTLGYDTSAKHAMLNETIGWRRHAPTIEAGMHPSDGTLNAVGRLMTGAFSTPRFVVPEVELDLKLKLGGSEVKRVNGVDEGIYLKIQRASLIMRRVCVAPKIAKDIMSKLKRSPAVYPYHLITSDITTMPNGNLGNQKLTQIINISIEGMAHHRISLRDKVPTRIFIAFRYDTEKHDSELVYDYGLRNQTVYPKEVGVLTKMITILIHFHVSAGHLFGREISAAKTIQRY